MTVMDIAYGPDHLHRFDWHVAPSLNSVRSPALIVFVHGGAWRSEDKSQHADLARSLARLSTLPVAVPNYRLTTPHTPTVQHPAHSTDLLQFLHFLISWAGPTANDPPPTQLYLLGHSCSAHMLSSILLASPYPELTPSHDLLRAVRAVVFSEGIYDVDALLRSFPSYREWFIASAFGDHPEYPGVNVAAYQLRANSDHIRWFVLHSTGDPLVDQLQSEIMYAHLSAIASAPDAPSTTSHPRVSKSFDQLNEGHNDILKGQVYPRLVADFITSDMAVI